jgi:hypothetical protein
MGFDPNYKSVDTKKESSVCVDENDTDLSLSPIISYDDVIDAHNFFFSLDEGWTKHLENRKREE